MADAAGLKHPVTPETQRLFFALWPDDATRDALNRTSKWLHQHWGGRRMRADTLHLTLAFLGNVAAEVRDALLPHMDAIHAEGFSLRLDHAGHWSHNRVGWLGCNTPPTQLRALADRLRVALRAAGVSFDANPFVPHVTLLRNTAGGVAPDFEPVDWHAKDFALIASETGEAGAHYTVLRRWPLY